MTMPKSTKKTWKKPTRLQELAAQKYLENNGKSLSGAMRDAGYSEGVAKNPQLLKKSPSWQELMDKYLPEKKVAEVHKGLLNAATPTMFSFDEEIPDEVIKQTLKDSGCKVIYIYISEKHNKFGTVRVKKAYCSVPNVKARQDATDMVYKLRGKYAAEKVKIEDPYEGLSDEEIKAKIVELEGMKRK